MARALNRGVQRVVDVAVRLVLAEILRPPQLADVVVIRADPGEQAVGADGVPALRPTAQHQAVGVGGRRLDGHAARQFVVEVRVLEQLNIGRNAEQALERRQKAPAR